MEDRTINIIYIAKQFCDVNQAKKYIAKYLADECRMPVSVYTESVLFQIIKEAFLDYLGNAKQNRSVACVRSYFDVISTKNELDRMLIALSFTRVSESNDYGDRWYIDTWHETEYMDVIDDWVSDLMQVEDNRGE